MQFLINLFKYIPSLCDHEASVLHCYSRILEFALDRRYKSMLIFHFLHNFRNILLSTGRSWTGCPWWSASSGSSATSPQSTFSRFHLLEGGACSDLLFDLLSCKSPKATISEAKIANLCLFFYFLIFEKADCAIFALLVGRSVSCSVDVTINFFQYIQA